MSEKIADALHEEYGKWLAEAAVADASDLDRPISVRISLPPDSRRVSGTIKKN